MNRLFLYILLVVLLASCRTQNYYGSGRVSKAQQAIADSIFYADTAYEYRIGKDDKISISLWGQDAWSVGSTYGIYNSNEAYGKWLLVDARGQVEVPKVGIVNVLGKTIPQLKDTLKLAFSKWIVNPVLDVKVLNKQIAILGEVRNPASVTVDKDNTPLTELIAKTGGHEFYANLKNVKVIRTVGDTTVAVQFDLNRLSHQCMTGILLHPGDIVVVSARSNKNFDKRIATIIPFATALTAATLLFKLF
jgi:polysaccharide biosynthesis/export protein